MTTLRKRIRRLARGFRARYMPARFAEWVNSERCGIEITNAPNGRWRVQIGYDHKPGVDDSLGRAMAKAFLIVDMNPQWMWPSDYLRNTEQ